MTDDRWQKRSLDPFGAAFVEGRKAAVLERLAKSASGYILPRRFSTVDRRALRELIEAGQVELVHVNSVKAYRLRK